MKKLMPLGPRVFVKDITPTDDVTARAQAAGISVVVLEENKPKPTQGVIVALGDDPEVHERLQEGDVVSFAWHAGYKQIIEGEEYRCVALPEIMSVIREIPEPTQEQLAESEKKLREFSRAAVTEKLSAFSRSQAYDEDPAKQ